jgi:putative PIN family toxin of toxin-antitoxin system
VRVCLDTNVIVAAFAARGLCADVLRVCLTEHDLVIGEVHLSELRRVLKRKLRLDSRQVDSVLSVFQEMPILKKPLDVKNLVARDPDDDWIIATALAGEAEVLVTGDEDLLTLNGPPIPIMPPRAFWELLRSS